MKCLFVICFEKLIHTNSKKDDQENDETDDYAQQLWWYHGFTEYNNEQVQASNNFKKWEDTMHNYVQYLQLKYLTTQQYNQKSPKFTTLLVTSEMSK